MAKGLSYCQKVNTFTSFGGEQTRHFTDGNHSISDLAFCGIDMMIPNRCGRNMEQILLQCECRYIFYLKTLHTSGINEDLDMTCFLFV